MINNNEKCNYDPETAKKEFQITNRWIFQYLTNYSRHVGVSNNCQLLVIEKEREKKKKNGWTDFLAISRQTVHRTRRWTYINRFWTHAWRDDVSCVHPPRWKIWTINDEWFCIRSASRRRGRAASWKLGSHDLYRLYFYIAFLQLLLRPMKETLENCSVVRLFLQFFNVNKKKKDCIRDDETNNVPFLLLNKFIQ